ncbi:MAG TPA: amidohydrolase family protein [Steroidobacteraceae bacterium]|nr:amidohydrolase family protein [Steroidobacteraceae bacterium]
MLTTHKFGLTLVLLISAVGGSALAQEGPAWPPHDTPVAMPQGQPAAAPPVSIIEAGELLTGRGQELHNTRILVKNGKIAAVGPNLTAPGAVIYDLHGATVMPGLIDVHVHLLRHFGPNDKAYDPRESKTQFALGVVNNLWVTLMSGFTTVQSVGDPQDEVFRQYVKEGIVPGPRILTSYHDIYGSPRVGNDDVLRAKVDLLKYEHADLVKIFASDSIRDGGNEILTLHQLQVLCGEANRIGLRTLVHAYNGSVHNAIVAGCTEVEHGTGGAQADIDLMAKKGTYFDPQVGLVVQNYIRFRKKFSGNGDYDAAGFTRMKDAIKVDERLFNAARRAGVKQVMGTDAVAGGFGHEADEIIARIGIGQPAMDAIDDATSVNAESLRLGKEIGSVAPGYDADIIAVEGDPLKDAARLRQVSFVMKGGTVYKDTVSAAGR